LPANSVSPEVGIDAACAGSEEPAVNKGAWAKRRKSNRHHFGLLRANSQARKARLREPAGLDAVKRFVRSVQSGKLEVRIAA